MDFFILNNIKMPWGDYGTILLSGMTSHLRRNDGLLQLERTGPFAPPITCSGISNIVVTDMFKRDLEASGLTGFTFIPVIKKHIVKLDWLGWNRKKEEPPKLPRSGEPEDYILSKRHNPRVAEKMGPMWEMKIEKGGRTERKEAVIPKI